jgi:hypothetical protein
MLGFKGRRFEREIIILVVKWCLSYPLSIFCMSFFCSTENVHCMTDSAGFNRMEGEAP